MAKKRSKLPAVIITLIVVLVLIVAGFFGYTYALRDINGSSEEGSAYTLQIKENDFKYQVAEKLKNNGIVVSDTVWNLWMDKYYPDFVFYNGEYNMTSNMSYEEIAKKLQNPDVSHKTVSVCIPEGYTVFEIANTLQENGICNSDEFLEACKTTEPYDYNFLAGFPTDRENIGFILEGFLFPATYDMSQNTPATEIVNQMLDAFDDRITDKMTAYCKENDMSLYSFISLCAVVQEEALNKESQGNIASVLINRLEKGSKLQCDVTYFYAKKLRDYGYSQDVYDAYYTYRCDGLPAGPICNPGIEIINSTINHPNTDYIYFFSDLKGDFHFAETYEEFETLKAKYPWKK